MRGHFIHLADEAAHSILIRHDGCELAITQSKASIHDRSNKVTGVIVFRSGAR